MLQINHVLAAALALLRALAGALLAGLAGIEALARAVLHQVGVQHQAQTVVLIALALALGWMVLRLIEGLLRIALMVLLVLLALHLLLPGLHA